MALVVTKKFTCWSVTGFYKDTTKHRPLYEVAVKSSRKQLAVHDDLQGQKRYTGKSYLHI